VWDSSRAADALPVAYISPQIEHVLGSPVEEWLEDPTAWHRHAHPEDAERVVDAWRNAVARRASFVEEYRMRTADGTWRWIRDEANPVGDETGELVYQGVMLDITDRHAAEDRLREAEERWRTLLEHLPVVAYMIESTPAGDVGERWVAPGIEGLLGVTAEEWLRDVTTWTRMLHPDDRDDVARAW